MGCKQFGMGHEGALEHGGDDKNADGDLPGYDVKKGPGRQLMEEEKQEIVMNETQRSPTGHT